MYKIAVLGDYDSIYGFATLGLDTFPVTTHEEAAEELHKLATGGYGIIYITEAWADQLKHEIARYQEKSSRRSSRFLALPVIREQESRALRSLWKWLSVLIFCFRNNKIRNGG